MSHLSAGAFTLIFALLGVVAAIVVTAIGQAGASKRLGAALAAGVILGGFFVVWISSTNRRAVAAAARSAHMSVTNLRADGLGGTALALAVILFAIATLASRKAATRSRSRSKARRQSATSGRGPARRRAGAVR